MQHRKLNPFQRVLLEILWVLARLFAILPYWVKYHLVENFIYFLLYHCIRYRVKVVDENLRNSFPEKSERERREIRRKYYRTLAEIVVDTINMAHMPDRKISRILSMDNVEQEMAKIKGRDWIALTAHYGCWEYYSYWGYFIPSQIVVAVYHPLKSPVMDELYRRLRESPYSATVPMHESLRFYLRQRGKLLRGRNLIMGLIADQNPPRRPDSHWFRFLNQDTLFFDGGEKLARKCHLPVYFIKMRRLERGRYELSCEPIYDGVEQVAENEITERYVRCLEKSIRETPELWIWSHRRWKHKRYVE